MSSTMGQNVTANAVNIIDQTRERCSTKTARMAEAASALPLKSIVVKNAKRTCRCFLEKPKICPMRNGSRIKIRYANMVMPTTRPNCEGSNAAKSDGPASAPVARVQPVGEVLPPQGLQRTVCGIRLSLDPRIGFQLRPTADGLPGMDKE